MSIEHNLNLNKNEKIQILWFCFLFYILLEEMFRRGIFVLCRTLADQESKQLERSFSLFLTNQPNLRSKSCETVKFLSTLNQEKTSKKTNQLNVKTVVNDLRAYNNFSEISVKENIKLFEKYKVKNVMENKELLLSSTGNFGNCFN